MEYGDNAINNHELDPEFRLLLNFCTRISSLAQFIDKNKHLNISDTHNIISKDVSKTKIFSSQKLFSFVHITRTQFIVVIIVT